ncbi:fumarylacetoacetate hydrolase family protein [Trinickia sp. NRRL B-1857]|uniref:fumarylacetoacetate hydrolase family protein n=1 Tax=Trinickia sp. NRRL B-1857 TaxID=3162879 RepID=UPI003D2E21FF
MKLVTYRRGERGFRAGALVDDGASIIDLSAASAHADARGVADPRFDSVLAMIGGADAALERAYELVRSAPASARVPRAEAILDAPVQPPVQMRDCLCFEGHLIQAFRNARKLRAQQFPDPEAKFAEMEREGVLAVPKTFYEQPIYYKANRLAVIGTDHDVRWPSYSNFLDFELEFGFFVGKRATDVSKEQARNYIYGYTIFNDVTARDAQTAEMGGQLGPAKGKDFDTANPMGPCLVTADELTDPYNLSMIARVNGEEWTRARSSTMYWSFEDVIAHISRSETLYPGEFIGSGTVEGGCGLELMRFLAPGDTVELEVEGIGVLRNRIVR